MPDKISTLEYLPHNFYQTDAQRSLALQNDHDHLVRRFITKLDSRTVKLDTARLALSPVEMYQKVLVDLRRCEYG